MGEKVGVAILKTNLRKHTSQASEIPILALYPRENEGQIQQEIWHSYSLEYYLHYNPDRTNRLKAC